MNEVLQLNKAIDLLSLWVNKINLSSAIDFYEINKVAENLAANLLNEIYDYQLINLNIEKRNFPAVDLGCDIKKIAFQITSSKELEKIESTLKKFVKYDLQNRFTNGVCFLFLTTDKAIKLTDSNKKKYQTIYNDFNSEKHILTVQDLLQEIQVLYNNDNEKFCNILKILEREFPTKSSDIAEIVKTLTNKHQQESQVKDEQIKALTHAITALTQGQGIIGTEAQINSAFEALKRGDVTEAKSLFTKVAEKSESVIQSESQKAAEAYRNLGALAYWDNNTQEALNAYRRATELEPDNADGWNDFGILLFGFGNFKEAENAYITALTLGEKHQNKMEIANAYGNLGNFYLILDDLNNAITFYSYALKLHEELGNKKGIADNYGNLGSIYLKLDDLNKAITFYSYALMLHEELGNKKGIADNYGNLGIVYQRKNEFDKSVYYHQKSLEINEIIGNKKGKATAYTNLGILYVLFAKLEQLSFNLHESSIKLNEATNYFQESFKLCYALGDKQGMAENYHNMGRINEERGNNVEARSCYQKSIDLFKQLGSSNADKVQDKLDALQ